MQLQADGLDIFRTEVYKPTKQVEIQKRAIQIAQGQVSASQSQTTTTKQTYGSMVKPIKTITIDVYQETNVEVEQKQRQIAQLIAQLKQLQESKVTVDPKVKVIVR